MRAFFCFGRIARGVHSKAGPRSPIANRSVLKDVPVDFVPVARTGQIPRGKALAVPVGSFEVAVFHVDDGFFALENCCPHQGGPLADGSLEGVMVTCPWHAWCFDVRTGQMSLGEFAVVPRFEVRVEGETIFVATEPMDE